MFEDSTFASAKRIHTRSPRYAAGSLVLQTALAATLVLLPYLYPSALPHKLLTVSLAAPPPPTAAPVVTHSATASRPQPVTIDMTLPTHIPRDPVHIIDTHTAAVPGPVNFGGPAGSTALPLGLPTPPPTPRVQPARPMGPLHVSEGSLPDNSSSLSSPATRPSPAPPAPRALSLSLPSSRPTVALRVSAS